MKKYEKINKNPEIKNKTLDKRSYLCLSHQTREFKTIINNYRENKKQKITVSLRDKIRNDLYKKNNLKLLILGDDKKDYDELIIKGMQFSPVEKVKFKLTEEKTFQKKDNNIKSNLIKKNFSLITRKKQYFSQKYLDDVINKKANFNNPSITLERTSSKSLLKANNNFLNLFSLESNKSINEPILLPDIKRCSLKNNKKRNFFDIHKLNKSLYSIVNSANKNSHKILIKTQKSLQENPQFKIRFNNIFQKMESNIKYNK